MVAGQRRFPFYIGISSLVMVIVVIMAILFLWISHRESRRVAVQVADTLFSEISKNTGQRYERTLGAVADLTRLMARMPIMAERPHGTGKGYAALPLFLEALSSRDCLYSLYVGYEDGSFVQLIAVRNNTSLVQQFHAPLHSSFVFRVISVDEHGRRNQYWHFLDKDGAVIGSGSVFDKDYDPRGRPWYGRALLEKNEFFTNPYIFSALKLPGVTCAEQLQGKDGVVGADITLDRFTLSLRKQKISQNGTLFLFDKSGNIVAHPSLETVVQGNTGQLALLKGKNSTNRQVRAIVSYALFSLSGAYNRTREIRVAGTAYLVRFADLQAAGKFEQILAVAAPLADFTEYIDRMWKRVFLFSLVVFFVMLPFAFIISRYIARSLTMLEHESQKIRLHDFSESEPCTSRIKEIHSLITAFTLMKQTIREYTEKLIKAKQEIEELFTAVTELLASAIDAKSPYTGGHCKRVPELARMLALAAHESTEEPFASFQIADEAEWRQFKVAAWLHDCGKITTPEFVVDKATKLETLYNRIHEVRMRFEILLRDVEIEYYRQCIAGLEEEPVLRQRMNDEKLEIVEDFSFVARSNLGAESMSDDDICRLHRIAGRTWLRFLDDRLGISHNEEAQKGAGGVAELPALEHVLSDKAEHIVPHLHDEMNDGERYGFTMHIPDHQYNWGEVYNLSIPRGTLTPEERFKIKQHIIQTIRMLSRLPFPDTMKDVVEIAGAHHETMIGTGYPKGLTMHEMSVSARILAIADIFEALTAADRPYKTPKMLSDALQIMSMMRDEHHIDSDLFDLFLESGVYELYAKKFMNQDQVDQVNISSYLSRGETDKSKE